MRHPDRMGTQVGPLVMEEFVVNGEDVARWVDGGPDEVALFARMIGREQMLAPVLDPFHRPAQAHCCRADQNVFWIKLAANTEAATNVRFVQLNAREAASEYARKGLAILVWHLGCAMQL
jgi:hypothetical protein